MQKNTETQRESVKREKKGYQQNSTAKQQQENIAGKCIPITGSFNRAIYIKKQRHLPYARTREILRLAEQVAIGQGNDTSGDGHGDNNTYSTGQCANIT